MQILGVRSMPNIEEILSLHTRYGWVRNIAFHLLLDYCQRIPFRFYDYVFCVRGYRQTPPDLWQGPSRYRALAKTTPVCCRIDSIIVLGTLDIK